jgi:hypothetical protein
MRVNLYAHSLACATQRIQGALRSGNMLGLVAEACPRTVEKFESARACAYSFARYAVGALS